MKRLFVAFAEWASMCSIAVACGSSTQGDGNSENGGPDASHSDGGPSGGGGPDAGPIDGNVPNGTGMGDADIGPEAGEFCTRFVEAFGRYMETCGCATTEIDAYRDWFAMYCEPTGFLGTLDAAVSAGDLVYDPDAATALFARLTDPDPLCVEEHYRALKLDSWEVYSFAGVFTGTHELGSPCTMPVSYKGGVSDCREGVCAPLESGGGVCIALVSEGEACDASGDHNLIGTTGRLCFDRRLSDIDGEYESAFDSLICIPTAPGAATSVCATDLTDGEPCHSGEACQSGRCVATDVPHIGVCTAKLADGEPCTSHAECLSGACQNTEPRVCGALLADGEPCDYRDAACASGSCNDPDGSGGVCGPAPSRDIGQTCTSSVECISSGHGDSRDGVCSNGVCIADICASQL